MSLVEEFEKEHYNDFHPLVWPETMSEIRSRKWYKDLYINWLESKTRKDK